MKIFLNIINLYCSKEEQTEVIRFSTVRLNAIQKIIYDIAIDETIVEKNRKKIYNLHKQYSQATQEELSTYITEGIEDESNSGGKKRKMKLDQTEKEVPTAKDRGRKEKVEIVENTSNTRPRRKATDYF